MCSYKEEALWTRKIICGEITDTKMGIIFKILYDNDAEKKKRNNKLFSVLSHNNKLFIIKIIKLFPQKFMFSPSGNTV